MFEAIKEEMKSEQIDIGSKAFKLEVKNLSPILQIDVSDDGSGSITKKQYQFVDGFEYPIAVPIYTANSLRGIMRRLALKTIDEIAKKTDPFYAANLSAETINFYASGDNNSISALQKLKYSEIERLREIMPSISLFGAGLSLIEGKLAVSSLVPSKEQLTNLKVTKNKDGSENEELIKTTLIKTLNGIRNDEVNGSPILSSMIDIEDVEEWIKSKMDNQVDNKRKKALEKKLLDKKELSELEKKELKDFSNFKNITTQMIHSHEYVIPGVTFFGSIGTKRGFDELTEVETGLMFSVLSELSQMQLGSLKNKGYGVVNWDISYEGYGDIISRANERYFLDKRTMELSSDVLKSIKEYEKWVTDNRVWEYLSVDKLFKKIKS
jgi:CRISPR type IV-associated protein Csf2